MAKIKRFRQLNVGSGKLTEKMNELIDKVNSMEDIVWQMVNDYYKAHTENTKRDRLQEQPGRQESHA